MLSYALDLIAEAERAAKHGGLVAALGALRQVPLDDFGELMISLPLSTFPRLSALLPRMASEQTQLNWTGTSGLSLLQQTSAFVRVLAYEYERFSGRALSEARILDFGCGYGRILRSLYYYTDPSNLYGCDSWDVSLRICQEDGLLGQFALSDDLPRSLPFPSPFDLIYAFSVFTHLSERATKQCLSTLADSLAPDGLLALTIRPEEYWAFNPSFTDAQRQALLQAHRARGFAFVPHNRPAIDGDVTYGDTSMSFAYLDRVEPRLKICRIERTLVDPFQIIAFLRRV